MLLSQALAPHGTVLGIDDDVDCVRFAQANVIRQCPGEQRVQIQREDFTAADLPLRGGFDLVTCMLGTLSHFGHDRGRAVAGDYKDTLQQCLLRWRLCLDMTAR